MMHVSHDCFAVCLVLSTLLACNAKDETPSICTSFAPTPDNDEGCVNPLLTVGEHHCEKLVAERCGADSEPDCASTTLADCATNYYLRNYTDDELPSCDPTHPTLPINRNLEISLYRYAEVSDAATVLHAKGLQAYYAPNQLLMHTADIARFESIRYAIGGTMAELNQALTDAGIAPTATSLTEEEQARAQKAIGQVIFAPTRAFFERHALPEQSKVNVVVIDQIVSPAMVELMDVDGIIVGLGLSPTLLERVEQADPNSGSLNTMLQVTERFTPTLFVGNTDITRLKVNFQHVVAHEMGHALGLPHVEDENNLMEQGGDVTCRHWLSEDQIAAMGPFSEVVPTSGSEGAASDAFERIVAARKRILEHVLDARRHRAVTGD
jgi:hypothetical protein